ncbi:MAG: hypothetical protein DRP00_01340 [Candidatus Aenigmatarchaeota archaeon]|nr:MAG: hypothetical protein DRP00_01340 [Candidatus Aenigmarchaeota archaeon]
MGIFSRIKGIFRRKKEEPVEELPEIPEEKPLESLEPATLENLKAKMDLILTQMESLKIQNETLMERLKIIEKLLIEIRKLAVS